MMEGPTVGVEVDDDQPKLPPGFRFHPTDEEIIVSYLMEKAFNVAFTSIAIGEADLNKCEPWDLPKKPGMGEKERYFFCRRDRKYPTGVRTNRATTSGYWKATGKDKEIFQGKNCLVGMKKTLVFYKGRAPKGEKMNWVMHEYRLAEGRSSSKFSNSAKDEWVVSKIFNKSTGTKKDCVGIQGSRSLNSYQVAHMQAPGYSSLPHLMNPGICTTISQSVGSLPRSSGGFYLDSFPGLPCEYPPVKPDEASLSMSDAFIRSTASNTSTNHYYSFDFGRPEKPLPMAMVSEETTDVSYFISNENHLDADLWDYDYRVGSMQILSPGF